MYVHHGTDPELNLQEACSSNVYNWLLIALHFFVIPVPQVFTAMLKGLPGRF